MDYITRIMASARVRLTGVVDDAIKLELFNTVDEFCRETDIWQEAIPFTTLPYVVDLVYDLVPTEGTILRLVDLTPADQPRPRTLNGTMRVPGELILHTPWNAGVDLVATVSLAPVDPTEAGTEFPVIADWIWQRHFTALVDGLIMKLAMTPDKPYTDPNLVIFHGKRFRNAIGVARMDNQRANLAGGQAWRFPEFGGGRRSSSGWPV